MPVTILEKTETRVHAMRFEGGRESALEICRWVGNGSSYIPTTNVDPREYLQVPTMFGPRDITAGNWVVRVNGVDGLGYLTYKPEALFAEYTEIKDGDSPLIAHARRELAMFPQEEPELIESLMAAVAGFATYSGHSGSSHAMAAHMLSSLVRMENLLPLTDDPEEWHLHKAGEAVEEDTWQNKRNSKALSLDGGKTYFLVNLPLGDDGERQIFNSEDHTFVPEIDPEDLKSDEDEAVEVLKEESDGSDLS